jgi:hypothetical protein
VKGYPLGTSFCELEMGHQRRRRSLSFFCKRDVYLFVGIVKTLRPDQRTLLHGRQNPIQLSKNDTDKTLERAKLLD